MTIVATTTLRADDPGYPGALRGQGRAVPLHVRGTLPAGRAVAIVGARAASAGGLELAWRLAGALVDEGVVVVSGGAIGIDGAAHEGALARGGRTVVVLGTGVDVDYPARHAGLFADVVAGGGAVVSAYPPGTPPRAGNFVRRNAIIASLAEIVIVIEAGLRSGSLSTANAAGKLGRRVVVHCGTPGCDRLRADGAEVIVEAADADATVRSLLAGPPAATTAAVDGIADADHRAVLAALARAEVAMSIEHLAEAAQLPPRTVLRATAALAQRGLVDGDGLRFHLTAFAQRTHSNVETTHG